METVLETMKVSGVREEGAEDRRKRRRRKGFFKLMHQHFSVLWDSPSHHFQNVSGVTVLSQDPGDLSREEKNRKSRHAGPSEVHTQTHTHAGRRTFPVLPW